jgi:hypothetical protein
MVTFMPVVLDILLLALDPVAADQLFGDHARAAER